MPSPRGSQPIIETPRPAPVSPTHQFVKEVLLPRREKMNTWENPLTHIEVLLEDAQKRRRLRPERISTDNYALSRSGKVLGGLDGRYTTLVSQQARRAAESLPMTQNYLQLSGVPVLEGKSFHVTQIGAAKRYTQATAAPVTLRGAVLPYGTSTFTGIVLGTDFDRAWSQISEELSKTRVINQQIHVGATTEGLQLKIYVVGEKAFGATVRVPMHVVGDGNSTLGQLLDAERARRGRCSYLGPRFTADNSQILKNSEYNPTTILNAGSLHFIGSLWTLQDPTVLCVDVLDHVDSTVTNLAVDAMWAFPGLDATAVTISTPSLDSAEGAVVLEVEPSADITEFMYPAYGHSRKLGLRILEHMIIAAR